MAITCPDQMESANTPRPGRSSFEFSVITVDPSSSTPISQSAAERSRVLQFVQTQRRRRENKKVAEKWMKYSSSMLLDQPTTAATSSFKPPSSGTRSSKRVDASAIIGTHTAVPTTNTTTPAAAAAPASTHQIEISNRDPFFSALVGFATVTPKDTFLAEAFAPLPVVTARPFVRHSAILAEKRRRFAKDPALFYSALAYASSSLAWSAGILDNDRPPEYFFDLALRSVRERFSDPDRQELDTWALLSAYCLATVQSWNEVPDFWSLCPAEYVARTKGKGAPNASPTMHLAALLDMVHRAGGWSRFDPYILESCILADKYGAMRENRPPLLGPLSWDPGAVPPRIIEARRATVGSLPKLGEDLLKIPMSPSMLTAVEQTVSYLRIAEDAWEHDANVSVDMESWLFLRLQAIINRLLALGGLRGQDECIRIATLLFLHNAITEHSAQIAAQALAGELRRALSSSSFSHASLDQGLRFWCLCTGAMTAYRSPARDWFLNMLKSYCHDVELTQNVFSDRLEPFLFLPARQANKLEDMIKNLSSSSL